MRREVNGEDRPVSSNRDVNGLNGDTYDYEIADGYELDYEPVGGITRGSLKRSGKYLVLSAVFLVICALLLIGYIMLYNTSIVSSERACWLQEQRMEQLAKRYVDVNGFASYPAYIEDIPGYQDLYADCPDGGTYTWNPVTGEYSCSEHQHYPNGFNQAESVNMGTDVTITNSNDES